MKQLLLVTTDREIARVLGGLEAPAAAGPTGRWKVIRARTAVAAWERLQAESFDAAVLDAGAADKTRHKATRKAAASASAGAADTPSGDLFEFGRRLQRDDRAAGVPVMMIVPADDLHTRRRAWQSGAADVVCRPILLEELQARLERLAAGGALEHLTGFDRGRRARKAPAAKTSSLLLWPPLKLLWRLAAAAECSEGSAVLHVVRVGLTSRELACASGLRAAEADMLLWAAPLHDVGNLAVPREIFQKPEPLDPDEWAVLKQHCRMGARLLEDDSGIAAALGTLPRQIRPRGRASAHAKRLLKTAATVALTHHERWDGSGYPQGLGEHEIPIEGRIVAVADVFDSLTSPRPYRGAYPEQTALEIMENTAGKLFDPEVYGAFLKVLSRIREIRWAFGGAGRRSAAECELGV